MRILVSNDDGINSRGIQELAEALSRHCEVFVAAPDTQRSAAGHGITVKTPISARKVEFPYAKEAYAISGTPADCVKVGLAILEEKGLGVDAVFTGINHGENLGTDTVYSGTVAGAREGNINNIPAVAVSVCDHNAFCFGYACKMAVEVLTDHLRKIDGRTTISINTPNLPEDQIKGVKLMPLGAPEYSRAFLPRCVTKDADGTMQYAYIEEPEKTVKAEGHCDIAAVQEGYATVTPLHFDFTDKKMLIEMKDWFK